VANESGHSLCYYCERNVLLQQHSDSGYFRFMSVDTVAGTTVWHLREANIWVFNASGMSY